MIPDRLWLGKFMKLDRYDQHYWSLSPNPTETDLRLLISGPGPTDLMKYRSDRARVSRRPRPITHPGRNSRSTPASSHICCSSYTSEICCILANYCPVPCYDGLVHCPY